MSRPSRGERPIQLNFTVCLFFNRIFNAGLMQHGGSEGAEGSPAPRTAGNKSPRLKRAPDSKELKQTILDFSGTTSAKQDAFRLVGVFTRQIGNNRLLDGCRDNLMSENEEAANPTIKGLLARLRARATICICCAVVSRKRLL